MHSTELIFYKKLTFFFLKVEILGKKRKYKKFKSINFFKEKIQEALIVVDTKVDHHLHHFILFIHTTPYLHTFILNTYTNLAIYTHFTMHTNTKYLHTYAIIATYAHFTIQTTYMMHAYIQHT